MYRLFIMVLFFVPSLANSACPNFRVLEGPCAIADGDLKMTDIQVIGTHNSYKQAIPESELSLIRWVNEYNATELDYWHRPIKEQLAAGVRKVELDIYHDPEGDRYSDPLLPKIMSFFDGPGFNSKGYDLPGLKVMHVQDFDQRSHCVLFTECLQQLKIWSAENPNHVPIFIMMNAKTANQNIPFEVPALPFDEAAYTNLDQEIRSIFPPEKLITPDDVRGSFSTLRQSVLTQGWPLLSQSRGKFLFGLDEPSEKIATYMRGKTNLEGLVVFPNTHDERAGHAAWFKIDDAITSKEEIQRLVAAGYLIRTRADIETIESRNNDITRRERALESGAQYISSDYFFSRPDFSPYQVRLPQGAIARCNPISHRCND